MCNFCVDKELTQDERSECHHQRYQILEDLKKRRPIYNFFGNASPFYLAIFFTYFWIYSYIPLNVHPVFTMIFGFVFGCFISYLFISSYERKLEKIEKDIKFKILSKRKV